MKRSVQAFLSALVLVLGAGVVVGRLSVRLPELVHPPGHSPSWLAEQLNLSTQQHQQMDAIWDDVKQKLGSTWDKRHELDRQRDQAVQDLLTPAQRAAYQKIYDDYHNQRTALEKSRDALVSEAEERSRALLSDSQKARWDELTREWHSHRPHPPFGTGFGPTSRWSGDHGPGSDDHHRGGSPNPGAADGGRPGL
jgi:hypothetical protein